MAAGQPAAAESEPGADLASFRSSATQSGSNFRPFPGYLQPTLVTFGSDILVHLHLCHHVEYQLEVEAQNFSCSSIKTGWKVELLCAKLLRHVSAQSCGRECKELWVIPAEKKARNSCPPSWTLSPFVHRELKAWQEGAAWRQRCDSCDSGSNAAVTAACTVQCTPGFLAKAFSWTQRKWDKKPSQQCSCESNSISAATEPCTVMYPQLFGRFKIFTFLEHWRSKAKSTFLAKVPGSSSRARWQSQWEAAWVRVWIPIVFWLYRQILQGKNISTIPNISIANTKISHNSYAWCSEESCPSDESSPFCLDICKMDLLSDFHFPFLAIIIMFWIASKAASVRTAYVAEILGWMYFWLGLTIDQVYGKFWSEKRLRERFIKKEKKKS